VRFGSAQIGWTVLLQHHVAAANRASAMMLRTEMLKVTSVVLMKDGAHHLLNHTLCKAHLKRTSTRSATIHLSRSGMD